jgi:hypothetical protein
MIKGFFLGLAEVWMVWMGGKPRIAGNFGEHGDSPVERGQI